MRPLLTKELSTFRERFSHFNDAELRSLDILSPTELTLSLAVQDSARAFDWITLTLQFSNVSDAKLLQSEQLSYIDMSEGATLLHEDGAFAFGIGECYNISRVKDSLLYIISTDLKYQESQF